MRINRLTEPGLGIFRGTAEEPVVWLSYPDRPPRWFEVIHHLHVHHNRKCLKNRFGTKCKEGVPDDGTD